PQFSKRRYVGQHQRAAASCRFEYRQAERFEYRRGNEDWPARQPLGQLPSVEPSEQMEMFRPDRAAMWRGGVPGSVEREGQQRCGPVERLRILDLVPESSRRERAVVLR